MHNDAFLQELTKYLIRTHHCHTIILYGSYSSGDFTAESDIDVIGFTDGFLEKNDTDLFLGKQLDAWIYPINKSKHAEQFLHIYKGTILLDEKNIATQVLNEVDNLIQAGPEPLSVQEKQFNIRWLWKMEARSRRNDVEGNYRRNWMLIDSLEIYFELQDMWFFGPKKAFAWIRRHDQTAYQLFDRAFVKDADKKEIQRLISFLEERAYLP